jgi:hypothetical protein
MEYDTYVRYIREEIEDKQGQEIKLIIRDYDEYIQHPVIAKIYREWKEGQDKLYIRDPLGKCYKDEKDPWGLEIIKEEDEARLSDPDFFKCPL